MDVKGINFLWQNGNKESWKRALNIYRLRVSDTDWDFESNHNASDVQAMGVDEFFVFLVGYYKWKYKGNYLSSRLEDLKYYDAEDRKEDLIQIRNRLFHDYDPKDTDGLLHAAMEIKGLGVAGASGLLAILFPNHYGTVDKFVIMALNEIHEISEFSDIEEKVKAMKPDYIRIKDAVILEEVFRVKANKLNEEFKTTEWTPKKIDMVLWAYRTEQNRSWSDIVMGDYGD